MDALQSLPKRAMPLRTLTRRAKCMLHSRAMLRVKEQTLRYAPASHPIRKVAHVFRQIHEPPARLAICSACTHPSSTALAVHAAGAARVLCPSRELNQVAERGFFAFDSDPNGGLYLLVAAPSSPRLATELSPAVAHVIRRVVFHRLRFAEIREIQSDLLLHTT